LVLCCSTPDENELSSFSRVEAPKVVGAPAAGQGQIELVYRSAVLRQVGRQATDTRMCEARPREGAFQHKTREGKC
jgi:hypothetical protein